MVHLGYGPLGLFLPQGEEGACTGNDATHALFSTAVVSDDTEGPGIKESVVRRKRSAGSSQR